MTRILIAAIFLLFVILSGCAYADSKELYRPYIHQFPQIIQEFDYPTIEAIEEFFIQLNKLPTGEIECITTENSITLKRRGTQFKAIVSAPDKGPIVFSKRVYKSQNTRVFFTTLRKILRDLSTKNECLDVKYDQFPTQAYKKRTIIEFNFDQKVVVLDAFSNGINDDERLYILDLMDKKESYFGGTI